MAQRTPLPACAFPSMHGLCQYLKIGSVYPRTIWTEKLSGTFMPVVYFHSFRIQGYNLPLQFSFLSERMSKVILKSMAVTTSAVPLLPAGLGLQHSPTKGNIWCLCWRNQIHQLRRGGADATPHCQVRVKGGQVCIPSLTQLLLWFSH